MSAGSMKKSFLLAGVAGRMNVVCLLIFLTCYTMSMKAIHISGFVRDKQSNEPLYPVNIWIKNTTVGTTTNEKGYFILADVPPGEQVIMFSYVGYRDQQIKVVADSGLSRRLIVLMEPIVLEGEQVVTEASREENHLDLKPGTVVLSSSRFQEMPSVIEPDVFRTFQFVPGVATLSDFSAGLYIRGGSPDQNLILLDQTDVYNPNHLFGFFSSFLPEAVKSAELIKGGFPARYGGRLSSVLNVQNREGNRNQFHGSLRINLINSSALLEGPWKKGSWMVAARRTYLDQTGKWFNYDIPYYFYDLQGKINLDWNPGNQFSISFYGGDDRLDLTDENSRIFLEWGNRTLAIQWMHLFSDRCYSQLVVAGSRFRSNTRVQFADVRFGIFNKIQDFSIKGNITYAGSASQTWDIGMEVKSLQFQLNNFIVSNLYPNEYRNLFLSTYLQDNIRLDSLTTLQPGIRFSYFTGGRYFRVEPRFTVQRLLSKRYSIMFSAGKFYQFFHLVQREGFSFADSWFPIDETFPPGEATHWILGGKWHPSSSFSLSLEGYAKFFHNLAEYREFRSADEPLEGQTAAQNFYRGKGHAYGMDLMISNQWKMLRGWIGYSLGWVKKKTTGYNFDQEYYPTYDRRHTMTMMQTIGLGESWFLTLSAKYASGQPFTQPTARYAATTPDNRIVYLPLEGRKNFFRLPSYQRVDIGLVKQWKMFSIPAEFTIALINVFNHKNVWYRNFDLESNQARINDKYMLPRFPSIGLQWEW